MTWANNSLQFDTKFSVEILHSFFLHCIEASTCVCAWRINNEDHAAAWNEVHESDDDALAQFSHIFHLHFISYLFSTKSQSLCSSSQRARIYLYRCDEMKLREKKKIVKKLDIRSLKRWETTTMEVGERNLIKMKIPSSKIAHIHELHDKWKAQSLFRHTQKTFPRFYWQRQTKWQKNIFPIEYSVRFFMCSQKNYYMTAYTVNTMWSHQIHIKRDVLT